MHHLGNDLPNPISINTYETENVGVANVRKNTQLFRSFCWTPMFLKYFLPVIRCES